LESDGSDLSLTDKLIIDRVWSDYDAETKDMYDTRKVGVDKVAIGKQFNGSYSEALKQAHEYISSKKYSVCCKMFYTKGLFEISIIANYEKRSV
jgi:hypothetical protein